jgi:N-ethylmaleimide reductase
MLNAVREEFREPLIIDGGRDGASAIAALADSRAELVALATRFISNPDLIERLERNLPLTPPDPQIFYEGGERGYSDYTHFSLYCRHLPCT